MALVLSAATKTAVATAVRSALLVTTHFHVVLGTAGCSMIAGVGVNVLAVLNATTVTVLGSPNQGFLSFGIGGVNSIATASGTPTVAMFCTDDGSSFPPGGPLDEVFRCTVGTSGADLIINDVITAGKPVRMHDNLFYQTCP